MTVCEEIKDARVSTRLVRLANSGLRYQSSSILFTRQQYWAIRAAFFYYASTCTLYVDPLQARPTKCCGRRSRYGKTCSFYMLSNHRAYNTYEYYLVLRYRGIDYYNNSSIQQTVYTWHCAQSTGRHYDCNCILPLFNMHLVLWGSSWIKHDRGAQICYPYVHLAFRRGECWHHRALGVGLFEDSDGVYMKNSVPCKRKHRAGPLDWCGRPHVYRKPCRRRKSVSPFLSMFWEGVYPFLSSVLLYWTKYDPESETELNEWTSNVKESDKWNWELDIINKRDWLRIETQVNENWIS